MPGIGIGRVVGFRTSGPPGWVISTAVMVAGRVVMGRFLSGISRAGRRTDCVSSWIAPDWQQASKIRAAGRWEGAMDEEDLAPLRKKAPPKDLTPLAVAELEIYIAGLEAEIERARGEIARKRAQKTGAEALFKR